MSVLVSGIRPCPVPGASRMVRVIRKGQAASRRTARKTRAIIRHHTLRGLYA
ncbi:MAG TPA: hypothetical protein VMY39_07000 [Planctomycetota bacterium]|nr:hypothetical protein [Planctomycetota bacterium]